MKCLFIDLVLSKYPLYHIMERQGLVVPKEKVFLLPGPTTSVAFVTHSLACLGIFKTWECSLADWFSQGPD